MDFPPCPFCLGSTRDHSEGCLRLTQVPISPHPWDVEDEASPPTIWVVTDWCNCTQDRFLGAFLSEVEAHRFAAEVNPISGGPTVRAVAP